MIWTPFPNGWFMALFYPHLKKWNTISKTANIKNKTSTSQWVTITTINLYIYIWLTPHMYTYLYGIFTYIWVIFRANGGKYSIHGAYGLWNIPCFPTLQKVLSKSIRLLYSIIQRNSLRDLPIGIGRGIWVPMCRWTRVATIFQSTGPTNHQRFMPVRTAYQTRRHATRICHRKFAPDMTLMYVLFTNWLLSKSQVPGSHHK